ncbi:transposase family protein [Bordetella holmesii]|nr:transposase family protein [Bordetella holmesii]
MGLRSHLPELPTPSRCHEILATPLQLASTPPRHRARCTHLQTQPGRIQPIDSSHLAYGRRFRCLTIVDYYTRECLAIEVDTSLPGLRVAMVLQRLAEMRGLPRSITVDNGPEFAGRALDAWAYQAGVKLSFIRPGKPVENAYIESFNGKFRDECLNEHWFLSLRQAKSLIENWRVEYNTDRPHSALGYLTPAQFVQAHQKEGLLPLGSMSVPY